MDNQAINDARLTVSEAGCKQRMPFVPRPTGVPGRASRFFSKQA
jgi:hypothetical protein